MQLHPPFTSVQMKLKFFTGRKATHDLATMADCNSPLAGHVAPSTSPACVVAAGFDTAFKKVMDKLDRIEALIDALPSSRGISIPVTATVQ